jgi:hypothetical protein
MKFFLTLFLLSATTAVAMYVQQSDVKTPAQIESSVATATGNLSSGTACVSSLSFSVGSYASLGTGQYIYDTTNPTYIPSNTTISALPGTCSAGQIKMSANATHNATGDTITVGGPNSNLVHISDFWDDIDSQLFSTSWTNGNLGCGTAANTYVLTCNGAGATTWSPASGGGSFSPVIANYYASTNHATSANTQINFDSMTIDTNSAVTTGSSWKFTVPSLSQGYCRVSVWTNNTNSGNAAIYLYKNGSAYVAMGYASATSFESSSGTYTVKVSTSDTLDFRSPSSTFTVGGNTVPGNGAGQSWVDIFCF